MARKVMEPAAPPPARAKLFQNGRSQAVRLPKAFRLPGTEVSVRREGEAVILEPIGKRDWPRDYWKRVGEMRRHLQLRQVPPLGGRLLDLSLDDEQADR